MFDGPIASLKHKLDMALKTTAGAVVASAAAVVALGFFCAAAFLWIARDYGPIVACLALGGAFLLITLVAILVVLLLNRRPPPPAAPRAAAWWSDPALLTVALEVGRTLGRRRLVSTVALSAMVLGILLNRSPRNRRENADADTDTRADGRADAGVDE